MPPGTGTSSSRAGGLGAQNRWGRPRGRNTKLPAAAVKMSSAISPWCSSAGALARRLVERIPRSALQLLVGILLSAFGSFWATEGLGIAWPGADLIIIALAAWYVLAAAWYIGRLRRQTRPASQLAPQHVR